MKKVPLFLLMLFLLSTPVMAGQATPKNEYLYEWVIDDDFNEIYENDSCSLPDGLDNQRWTGASRRSRSDRELINVRGGHPEIVRCLNCDKNLYKHGLVTSAKGSYASPDTMVLRITFVPLVGGENNFIT